jgi:tetratricopeptide (TPR) repeat protein
MWLWNRLFLIVLLSSTLGANTIEYMGISFECEEGCAVPAYDRKARQLIQTFQKAIHEVFDDKWGLIDSSGIWRSFDPYDQGNVSIREEDCEISRYDWEKSNGILVHYGADFYDRVIPDWQFVQTHHFNLTYSDVMKEFSIFREDLSYYAKQKEKYQKNRLQMHQQNALEIHKLEENFSAVLYDSHTDQVLDGARWSFIYGAAHELIMNYDGTYTRQIRFAREHENKEIQIIEEELKNPIHEHSLESIDSWSQIADSLLKEIFLYCLQKHQPEGIEFHAAIESLLIGDPLDGIAHLRKLLDIGKKNNYNAQIVSKLHFLKGQLESECTLYGDAIVSLTEAIAKMPSMKEAYIERATAYFELGEFDLCIEDYLQSGIKSDSRTLLERFSFSVGLTQGLISGGAEASIEFIPSLLSSLQGIGQGLWAFAADPVQISSEFVRASYACIEFIKDYSAKQVFTELVPELRDLIGKWNVLDDREKGEITGRVIGKFGVDIFAGAGLVKGVKIYKDLKRANNLLTFETLALSQRHEAFIKVESARKLVARKDVLKNANLEVEFDKQTKHIFKNKNFQPGKSIFEHPNPQDLVLRFAGTGIKDSRCLLGTAGYKEIVNFGEFIGYHVDQNTGQRIATTWGKIHYSKKGVHIVPTSPRN